MIEKNKIILIFLPNYQSNHESYYNILINNVFKNKNLIILAYTFNSNRLNTNNVKYYYPIKGESLNTFALKNIKFFNKADLIVFEELYKISFIITTILVLYGYKTILSIHNVNKWLKRETRLKKNLIKEIIIKIVIKRIKGLIVISLSLKDYIYEYKLFKKEVYYVPFVDVKNNIGFVRNNIKKEKTVFTIPGTVNTERRDYKSFFYVVLKFLNENRINEIQLVLLGRVIKMQTEEQQLIDKINGFKKGTIKYWDKFIDDKTFEKEILNSDFLIGNINIEYKENLIKEIYGQSKETGVLFLMLKYNIPTLFPNDYKPNKVYKRSIIYYENNIEDVYKLMSGLIEGHYPPVELVNEESNHLEIIEKEIKRINSI